MCVVALALNAHPRWPLVVIGNRDEFHARPSAPLARWTEASGVIAGRDLVSGGSWFGLSEAGRVAVVTNVRNPDGPDPALKSRGALVSEWLEHGTAPGIDTLADYNPFTLCLIEGSAAKRLSNRPMAVSHALGPGLHSLSNGEGDAPWPRRTRLQGALAHWLTSGSEDAAALFDTLADEAPCGGPEDAPIFIRAPVYGTRCSTVLAVAADGQGFIAERRFDEEGAAIGEAIERFAWPGVARG